VSERVRILLYALWMAQPVLQTAIAVVMFRRGQHRVFKYFFTYIIVLVLIFALIFPVYMHSASAYFYLFWLTTAITVVLGSMVIYEAFLDVFQSFHALRDLGKVLIEWAGLLLLLVAGVISISTRASNTAPWVGAIMATHRCIRIIQVGMVLFLLIFARYMGVNWRRHSLGIAIGFGTFAVVDLVTNATWAGYHVSDVSMSLVNMVAYNCALLIWLGYSLARNPSEASAPHPQRWGQVLAGVRYPSAADSFIPTFEAMVDRALARSQAAPSPTIYRELSLLETELHKNIKALRFTLTQILRRLARLGLLNRNPQSRGENSEDR